MATSALHSACSRTPINVKTRMTRVNLFFRIIQIKYKSCATLWTETLGWCIYCDRHQTNSGFKFLNVKQVRIQIVRPLEEQRFQHLMQSHHYLGALPKISETLWYTARLNSEWIALVSFSAPALKCTPRDSWIGWEFSPSIRSTETGNQ